MDRWESTQTLVHAKQKASD